MTDRDAVLLEIGDAAIDMLKKRNAELEAALRYLLEAVECDDRVNAGDYVGARRNARDVLQKSGKN